ncbi:hypothetical protein INR49_029241, partial [Caranx melampygus]
WGQAAGTTLQQLIGHSVTLRAEDGGICTWSLSKLGLHGYQSIRSSYESDDKSKLPEEPVTWTQSCDLNSPTDTEQKLHDTAPVNQSASRAESSCVNAMVEAIALSGNLVKSQQIGEAELTLGQRKEELLNQYRGKPLVFLERYHTCLKPQHLSAFAHVSSDPRTQHYSKVIQRRAAACTNRTRVRNQRYAALRALQKEGQYFSEEQMRIREPLLYEQYIGQYLTDEEVLERSQEAMLDGAQGEQGAPSGGTGGLAHLLLNSYQERLIQNRLQEEQEREDCQQEEEEDEDDDADIQLTIPMGEQHDGVVPHSRAKHVFNQTTIPMGEQHDGVVPHSRAKHVFNQTPFIRHHFRSASLCRRAMTVSCLEDSSSSAVAILPRDSAIRTSLLSRLFSLASTLRRATRSR